MLLAVVVLLVTLSVVLAQEDVKLVANVSAHSGSSEVSPAPHHDHHRQYWFKKCRGSGCPYTASWLSHINLYKRVGWHLESTKMETASFNIFDRSQLKFQMSDPSAYFVHHMSMYEHLLHKQYGFDVASNKSKTMSLAAFEGECMNETSIKLMHRGSGRGDRAEYLTLVPFYGGLPPAVTQDYSKVNSIGQGNSLVDASIKVLQCMASVCSCLRYFGHVIVGVSRESDLQLLDEMLLKLDAKTRHHIHVVQFEMPKPAHLPFHLLAWGQQFVQRHNCGLQKEQKTADASASAAGKSARKHVVLDSDVYEICEDQYLSQQHRGGPVNAIKYMNFRAFSRALDTPWIKDNITFAGHRRLEASSPPAPLRNGSNPYRGLKHLKPFRFVYYTEMDQIVRFDSVETFKALSAASNSSCFFTGRRKEKERDSDATDYMGQLSQWRECGEAGYSMNWPADIHVRATKLPE